MVLSKCFSFAYDNDREQNICTGVVKGYSYKPCFKSLRMKINLKYFNILRYPIFDCNFLTAFFRQHLEKLYVAHIKF